MDRPRILLLDAYDSYSNNIKALLRQSLHAHVVVRRVDDKTLEPEESFKTFIAGFDAVVAGPGPGSAVNEADVGLMRRLWSLDPPVPVLGVCLGFQSLALAHGACIRRLPQPRHGVLAEIQHRGGSIFNDAGNVRAVQYNSLHIDLGHHLESQEEGPFWYPASASPDLEPLAWVVDCDNGAICMAIRHTSKPFWGIQFHPESIFTNPEGAKVISTWWAEAAAWLREHRPSVSKYADLSTYRGLPASVPPANRLVTWDVTPLLDLQVSQLCRVLTSQSGPAVVLESGTRANGVPVNADTGRFSIISCTDMHTTDSFEYYVKSQTLRHVRPRNSPTQTCSVEALWPCLRRFVDSNRAVGGVVQVPFWGGLIGFVSYEACLQTIDVESRRSSAGEADACFSFVDRSIVVDHVEARIYVQSIRSRDDDWVKSVLATIRKTSNMKVHPVLKETDRNLFQRNAMDQGRQRPHLEPDSKPFPTSTRHDTVISIEGPSQRQYRAKVDRCKELIRAGESYELCLTDQTLINTKVQSSSPGAHERSLYQHLRSANPAPFGAFLRLPCGEGTVNILSSSPERFLSWSRQGRCQYRPIKGTVKKSPDTTYEMAEAILKSSKEQAENLMIVDLIRHDLNGIIEYGNVETKKLMEVEEYESVYQLVSVIEGQLPADGSKTGLDVLAASLPPGSMTGAPKRRSCKLLQDIEEKPRGMYSGVLGYLDVGGGGDFSVIIRTAVKWDGVRAVSSTAASPGSEPSATETWKVGAGGAVTIQSTSLGEWEEMQMKRETLLNVFTGLASPPPAPSIALVARSYPTKCSGVEFDLLTSLRFDPLLQTHGQRQPHTAAPTADDPTESTALYLPHLHTQRLLRAARYFGWQTTPAGLVRGPLTSPAAFNTWVLHAVSNWQQSRIGANSHHPDDTARPLKVRILLDAKGQLRASCAYVPAVPSLFSLFPPGLPTPRELLAADSLGGWPPLASWTLGLDTVCTAESQPANPHLHFKSTLRSAYDAARQRCPAPVSSNKMHEVVLHNSDGHITEGSFNTVYLWRHGRWVTSPVSEAFDVEGKGDTASGKPAAQDGTTRRFAIESGLCVVEAVLKESVRDGEVAWVSNGVRGFGWGQIRL